MVLGLIDFLLGGKKKTKVPKNAQVVSPMNNVGNSVAGQTQVPDGQNIATQNVQSTQPKDLNQEGSNNLVFQDSNSNSNNYGSAQIVNNYSQSQGSKKSISEVISKIYQELKDTNETIANMATDVKELQTNVSELDHKISDIEAENAKTKEKLADVDDNMSKFLSLYELVNNQYNPFVDSTDPGVQNHKAKEILIKADGNTQSEDLSSEELKEKIKSLDVSSYTKVDNKNKQDLESSLLELDTLNIEEAAADAVPLTHLKNNTNSLVIILSWLEYLIKKVGVEESKNALRYYTETLKWITPEVYFELEKYLRGMEDIKDAKLKKLLNVRDHIVSLYFISKLNEKVLDSKLTTAVLQIIKD